MHDWIALKEKIRGWGAELGFGQVGFAGIDLGAAEAGLLDWLAQGHHGAMDYMAAHGTKRSRPAELVPGTQAVISCRMDYLPEIRRPPGADFQAADDAAISRYALGRDYHKLMRNRLQKLADRIAAEIGAEWEKISHRVFVDSAPVMEIELAQNAGLGWRGKHTLLLSRSGSWFFLGEIFVALPLPADAPQNGHCGDCTACLEACPTDAFIAPYRIDARRCISYLTIEHAGPIPDEFRRAIGNRIYGCDDCLAVCPWNKFADAARANRAFLPRAELVAPALADLLTLDDAGFRQAFAGSPIKRIGRNRMVRNAAIAAGNSGDPTLAGALRPLTADPDPVVAEAAGWALAQLLPA